MTKNINHPILRSWYNVNNMIGIKISAAPTIIIKTSTNGKMKCAINNPELPISKDSHISSFWR